MNTAMQQRGVSFGGFLIGAFLLVIFGITGLKLIPAFIQDAQIKNLFVTIAHDPDMQKATPHDIKASFERRTVIDNITAIKADDIDISSDGGRPVLSASYAVKVKLFGNVSFYIEFNPSSEGK
jgi:hypothetical protein